MPRQRQKQLAQRELLKPLQDDITAQQIARAAGAGWERDGGETARRRDRERGTALLNLELNPSAPLTAEL
jgi:hypothetical protein